MTKEKIDRWIKENGEALAEFYGLHDWSIGYTFGEGQGAYNFGNKNFKTQAYVDRMPEYHKAKIFLNADWIKDEDELFETLAHELCHVVCSPYIQFFRAAACLPNLSKQTRKILDEVWHQAEEEAVMALTRMTNGHIKWKNQGKIVKDTKTKHARR